MNRTLYTLLFALTLLCARPSQADVTATFNSATDVPVTAPSFSASGETFSATLNFAPPAGTNLMVVKNTGLDFINGTFSNLAQGQQVTLSYSGVKYQFIANYYGGTGNDLVLQWAKTRLVAWGDNGSGQVGNNSTTDSLVPVDVLSTGVLSGKTVISATAGQSHSLALCSDGTVAAWGYNGSGQLGNNSTVNSKVPVAVDTTGVLSGKTVVAVAAGQHHSLALCSDGTVAAWGYNYYGQLGNNSTTDSTVPVAVRKTGALADKTVVAVAAGEYDSLALCSDGTIAVWGYNNSGGTIPVAVETTGVLSGKTVVAVTKGKDHSLVLCSDGMLAAWGGNIFGQLGINGMFSTVPVAVDTGVLAGKAVVAVAAGQYHSLALCFDGTIARWGSGDSVPTAVNTIGVFSGKTVVNVAAGQSHSLALCSDGTLAAWGYNADGQLGNNSTTSGAEPVVVNSSLLGYGERFATVFSGPNASHSLGLIASPPFPTVTSLVATNLTRTGATLSGTVNPNGNPATAQFEYGTTTSYGSSASVTFSPNDGIDAQSVSTSLSDLTPGTIYHYRLTATNGVSTVSTPDRTFTTLPSLTNLILSAEEFSPVFASDTTNYTATTSSDTITVTPVAAGTASTVKVNGVIVTAGNASGAIALGYGANTVSIVVTAQDGTTTRTYTITVIRRPQTPLVVSYTTSDDVPLATNGFIATGSAVSLSLNFAPSVGTNLMVINNTGLDFIKGTFSNLAQGQIVTLSYGRINYRFIANYYGGTGNDLVLQWANTRLVAWGANAAGQLGNNSTTNSSVPVAVDTTVLSDKAIVAVTTGYSHSLALYSDGTMAAWGYNAYGQLGNNSATDSSIPLAVGTTGALTGKTIVAVAAGERHSLALCSDGTVAAWGHNAFGQLGNNSTISSPVPVAVDTTGVLAGKTIVAVTAGQNHSLALCSDGTVAAWGDNRLGQLGRTSIQTSKVPVMVNNTAGALAGKTVISVAAGSAHSLALCTDGTLAAWGYNLNGQLGNNSFTQSAVPLMVNNTAGALAGKTVIAVAAGNTHSLALCSDGTLAAWGNNARGQLGNNGSTTGSSVVPAAVDTSGVLAGKSVVSIVAGGTHSLALCSDGTVATWGYNAYGQLGNDTPLQSTVPVVVSSSPLATGERYSAALSSSTATHNLGLIASPPAPVVTSLSTTNLTSDSVVLNSTVNASSGSATVSFDYGLDTAYGNTITGTPSPVTGSAETAVSAYLASLKPDTTYHYRVRATSSGGATNGADLTFTTLPDTTGPVGGTVTFAPTSPVDAGSALAMTFTNWTDPSTPLTYSVLLDDEVVSAQGASATRNFTAPATAGTHTLKGRIYDALGHVTEVTQSFTVITTQAEWRTFYFGTAANEGNAADLADPDGDGANNLFEYVAGLVPTSAQSRFNVRVEAVAGQPTQKAIIFSPVLAGRTYTVKYKASLTDEIWTSLTDIGTSDNGTERTVTDLSAGSGLRFYRVEITQP
ncbi:RCC1 domain-containing protein [Verrucomicrobiota bacterium sgz303538]